MTMAHTDRSGGRLAGRGLLAIALCSLALSACTNTNQGGTLPSNAVDNRPAPITPAPRAAVNGTELRPTSPDAPQTDVVETPEETPEQQQPVEVARVNPTDGQPVTREALIGAWTVSTGGSNCQIFLALTKWSGGYRAASRGCSAASISDVQAWDVRGKQVVLVDSNGSTAATLFRSGESRFDGSTSGGGSISFSR